MPITYSVPIYFELLLSYEGDFLDILDRIKDAFNVLRGKGESPIHPFGIVIGEKEYMADAYRLSRYGLPEWFLVDPVHGSLRESKYDGWILKDYEPGITLEEFKAGKDVSRIDRCPMDQ